MMFVRTRNLYQNGAASKTEFEQRQLAYETSENAYKSAVTRYKDLKRQIEINARQAQNNLAISSKTQEDYKIRSDLNGTVYSILKEKGELVSPQMPVAIVGSANQFVLEMQVDEYDIAKIARDQRVFVTMDSYKGQVFEAKLTRVNPIMNERSKTFTVEAVFTKNPPKVFPNTSFEASIVLHSKAKAMVIPKRYLLQGNMVMLADGRKVPVKVGLRDFEFVEILGGISKSDKLILEE
jgi:multidrug efflux pump subunit AcrA (membrane-fusion protein)